MIRSRHEQNTTQSKSAEAFSLPKQLLLPGKNNRFWSLRVQANYSQDVKMKHLIAVKVTEKYVLFKVKCILNETA